VGQGKMNGNATKTFLGIPASALGQGQASPGLAETPLNVGRVGSRTSHEPAGSFAFQVCKEARHRLEIAAGLAWLR